MLSLTRASAPPAADTAEAVAAAGSQVMKTPSSTVKLNMSRNAPCHARLLLGPVHRGCTASRAAGKTEQASSSLVAASASRRPLGSSCFGRNPRDAALAQGANTPSKTWPLPPADRMEAACTCLLLLRLWSALLGW